MTTAHSSRITRTTASILGVGGALLLTACSGGGEPGVTYADGTYTADGSYQTPRSVEKISVTLTLADGKVTDVQVTGDPQQPETKQYQAQFIGGISDEVVGKPIDDLQVTRVAGSSLTSTGFLDAVKKIKAEAAAE